MPKFTAVDRDARMQRGLAAADHDFRFVSHDTVAPVVLAEAAGCSAIRYAFSLPSGRVNGLVAGLSFRAKPPTSSRRQAENGLCRYVPACYRFAPFRLMQIEASTDAVLCIDEDRGCLRTRAKSASPSSTEVVNCRNR